MKFQIQSTQEQIDLHKLGAKYLTLFWCTKDSNLAEYYKKMCLVVINVLCERSALTNNSSKPNR